MLKPDGSPATALSARRDAWVVIHGFGGSARNANIARLATAIDAGSARDQVLMLDWSGVAAQSLGAATANAGQVAAEAAAELKALGVSSGARLNLVGYSLGGYVTSKLASLYPGGVNRIVALDPASPIVGKNRRGTTITDPLNLAAKSQYSIAFHSGASMSHVTAYSSADDVVKVDGLGTDDGSDADNLRKHVNIVSFFARAMEVTNGVVRASRAERRADGLFSMKSIATTTPGHQPWSANCMGCAYDARVSAAGQACSATSFAFRDAEDGAVDTI